MMALVSDTDAAIAQEQIAWLEAQVTYLQQRVIKLNLEVRVRDARIAELEANSHTADTGE